MMQMELERDITESLFADLDVNANSLNQEKDYINFGKKVAGVLYEGQAPYRIPVFFKELVRDLSKQIESKKIKEILDTVTALYNEKVKEEKEKEKSGKGGAGKAKAQLKAGKQHLNQQLVSNLMGEDEDDEYGEETYKREQEADYDFMWRNWNNIDLTWACCGTFRPFRVRTCVDTMMPYKDEPISISFDRSEVFDKSQTEKRLAWRRGRHYS